MVTVRGFPRKPFRPVAKPTKWIYVGFFTAMFFCKSPQFFEKHHRIMVMVSVA
jgi:hypothetical protein